MKRIISILMTMTVILSVLTGCSATGKQESTVAENAEGAAFTVHIVNQSAVKLHDVAVSYSVNGETLGSKVSEHVKVKAEQTVYEFRFVPDELSSSPIDDLRLEVFVAEKAGEDYSACGSAVIKSPQAVEVFTLSLHGEEAAALTLSTTAENIELKD